MMEKETLEQKTLMELRTMAKEMGLGPISALKKGDLIARIKEKQSQSLAKNVEDVTVCGFSEETAQMPKEEMAQPENHERPQRETPENQEQGEGILEIVNLKCDPVLVGSLRSEPGFFPAYHMNKENWISVALDGSVPDSKIKMLLDLSYDATNRRQNRA